MLAGILVSTIKQQALAKLSQPKLFGIVNRIRLFSLLDKERERHPVVWVSSPPGAGKTAFVVSYLEACKLSAIWYQVDGGDSDLATFFYYMGLAGRAVAGRTRAVLPVLTPEHLSDLPTFTRGFFRKFFSSVSPTSILVLDNYQEVVTESVFHTVVSGIIAELPAGFSLIVISNLEPPLQLTRALANNLIGQINWEDLRLTLAETTAIAAKADLQKPDEATLISLQEQTNGWAAGLVLMMQRLKEAGRVNHISRPETMERIFNYFVGQIFEQVSTDMREFLMRTAILPSMTLKMATDISASPKSREFLDYLYCRRLFIDRRGSDEISYQYHALFREFLLDRAQAYFSLRELGDIKGRAAGLLEQSGEIETAAKLLAEAQDWKKLVELIQRHAAALLDQGRNQTLQRLIALLPPITISDEPWLLYWRGVSGVHLDPQKAIVDFEHAYTRFKVLDDKTGSFLVVGAAINAFFYRTASMAPVLPWAEQLQQLLTQHGDFPSVEIEATVIASLQGLVFAAPHHLLLVDLEQRVDRLLQANIEPILKISVGITFLWLFLWRGDFRKAGHIISELNPVVRQAHLPPMLLILWKTAEGNLAWHTACHQLASDKFSEGRDISRQSGLPILDCMLWSCGAYSALAAGDVETAHLCLNHIEPLIHPQCKMAVAEFHSLRSGVQFLQGDVHAACATAKEALALHQEANVPYLTAAIRVGLAQTLMESGDLDSARHHLSTVIECARTMQSHLLEHQALLLQAYSWIKSNQEFQALGPLREGLHIAADNDYLVLNPWWRPQVIARLFSLALQSGIEVAYVQSVIRRRNIKAESQELEIWPWVIKIHTLGHFEILCNDIPLHASVKTQHKPLDLLKCLCAYGGHAVNRNRLIDALWPDAEGDDGERALRTTLHRLRKLLKQDESILLEGHHLSLNPGYIWVDWLAFDRIAHRPDITDRVSLQHALNRYRGDFLEGETSSWALACRSRLRNHHMSLSERFGQLLERDNNWSDAAACYVRAIEINPVAETFYCRLMNAYAHLGRRAEALAVYQRCRQSLLTRLGISARPASDIQILYQKLTNS
jgi:ATP/maltotriose-dependent transcriptional regulator MalT/DNA-binding SARP family transcriptional activator